MKMDLEQVKQILPHRDPMLLIGSVDEIEPGVFVTASLRIDPEREIFRGHFPGEPVLPGVYSVEAMAQAADLVIMTMPEYAGKVPLLLGVEEAKFFRKVLPGETLTLRADLIRERKDEAVITCRCTARVGEETAASAEVTIAMR